ncbi:MAG: DUF1854 domain-containing protein [Eubacteriales bacterium]
MAEPKKNEKTALSDVVAVTYITKDNATFEKDNDFVKMTLTVSNEEGETETKTYDRIFLHRAFPFDHPYAYISVLDADSRELGIIADVDALGEDAAALLRAELERKYYTPVIRKILSLKDKFGFSYWKVLTDEGELSFTLRDTFQSLMKVGGTRIFVNDIDGNRYEIPNIEELDRKSYHKIELFL